MADIDMHAFSLLGSDLLDRLEHLTLETTSCPSDVFYDKPHVPGKLLEVFSGLADKIALVTHLHVSDDPLQLESALGKLRACRSETQPFSFKQLDSALRAVHAAVIGGDGVQSWEEGGVAARIEALQQLVAYVQAGMLKTNRGSQSTEVKETCLLTQTTTSTDQSSSSHNPQSTTATQNSNAATALPDHPIDQTMENNTAILPDSSHTPTPSSRIVHTSTSQDANWSAASSNKGVACHIRALATLLDVDAQRSRSIPVLKEVTEKLQQAMPSLPERFFEPIIAESKLNVAQMEKLREVDAELRKDYQLRRAMLIERAKVTLQCFAKSSKVEEEGTSGQVAALVSLHCSSMHVQPNVQLQDVFTTCPADLVPLVTRSASQQLGAAAKSLRLEGEVKDRGGKPTSRLLEPGLTKAVRAVEKSEAEGVDAGRKIGEKAKRLQG